MTEIRLTETGPPVEARLSHAVVETLSGLGVVDITPAATDGRWLLSGRGSVGVIRVGEVVLRVAPKLPVGQLVFLLDFALRRVRWETASVTVATTDDLMHAMAEIHLRACDTALQRGLLQGYRVVEESAPVVRGRIRSSDQYLRRFGLPVPVEVRYDDYTVDTDENRILSAATERLLRLPGLDRTARTRLLRLRHRFADVAPLIRGTALPRWTVTRLNARYEPALRVAELVLTGSSFEHAAGSLPVSGFMVSMPMVFEDFLTAALSGSLEGFGGTVKAQRTAYLDDEERVRIRPDIVWLDDAGTARAVIDAKYKAERPSGFPDADLYQALAYAIAHDLPVAHLVYAKGNDSHQGHIIRHLGTQLRTHSLDLSLPPLQLMAQVDRLAEGMAKVAGCSRDVLTDGNTPDARSPLGVLA